MVIKFWTSIGPAHWTVDDDKVIESIAMLHKMPGVLQNHPDFPIEVLIDNPADRV